MSRQLLEQKQGRLGDLCLWRTDDYGPEGYELAVNGVFAMATYNRGSAAALYRYAADALGQGRDDVDVLVGGLGMGCTVATAVADSRVRHVDVVEVEPALCAWNQQYFAPHNDHCLEDDRVRVHLDDFRHFVSSRASEYDLVCMDIDNGPAFLIAQGNEEVYRSAFLSELGHHITAGGVLSIWSSTRDAHVEESLGVARYEVAVREVAEVWGEREETYYIYVARREPNSLGGAASTRFGD